MAAKRKDQSTGKSSDPPVPPREGTFRAELAEWAGQKFAAKTQDEATRVAEVLDRAAYAVSKIEQKDRAERTQPPFTTSTLQQQANIRLRFAACRRE